MEMHSVYSSNISAIGYENNTLYVRFHRGGTYAYHGVPKNLFINLMNAASKGEYFAQFIKNSFPYNRI